MKLVPRFIFHGTAAAFGGRLVRPDDIWLESECAASLPRAGGRATASSPGGAFGDAVRFGSSRAEVTGVFDDFGQAIELTYGNIEEHTMATSTNVEAEVENVAVGRGKVLTVSRLKGALLSRSAALGAETPILLAEDVAIDGIAFHGHRLRVDLDVALFRRHDTRGKLMTAAADATFLRTHAASFFFPARGPAHATIVRSLRWDGDSYPGAVVDGHTVSVPDFGRVFFGEIIIDDSARRLTMMRVELTASHAGHIAFVEVETGGMWHPSHR